MAGSAGFPIYVDVVVKRWQALTGKQALLDGDGRTFEEVGTTRLVPDGVDCQPVGSC